MAKIEETDEYKKLKKLNKKEQEEILKTLGMKDFIQLEDDRIRLILKLKNEVKPEIKEISNPVQKVSNEPKFKCFCDSTEFEKSDGVDIIIYTCKNCGRKINKFK